MAAAPDLSFEVPLTASPELALVDADLAAELRGTLRVPQEQFARSGPPPRKSFRPTESAAVDDQIVEATELVDASRQSSPTDELIVIPDERPAASAVIEPAIEPDPIVDPPAALDEGPREVSHYPELPALDPKLTDETEAVLLRIREQLAVREVPRASRRIRRGFTVASGLVAAYALAGVVAAVQLGLMSMLALH